MSLGGEFNRIRLTAAERYYKRTAATRQSLSRIPSGGQGKFSQSVTCESIDSGLIKNDLWIEGKNCRQYLIWRSEVLFAPVLSANSTLFAKPEVAAAMQGKVCLGRRQRFLLCRPAGRRNR